MSNKVRVEITNPVEAVTNAFVRITSTDRTELFSGQVASWDVDGVVDIEIGEVGTVDEDVIISVDTYVEGSEVMKSFSGVAKVELVAAV